MPCPNWSQYKQQEHTTCAWKSSKGSSMSDLATQEHLKQILQTPTSPMSPKSEIVA
ncbi:hypothetical protein PROFUN_13121 [Planoprotostelium fungivorum]|uniref:Uncharacterized protein n=1 Tax=Planoprotostelium fungivorum TaxID=1890364 RepID=A0A2P6N521_9EUKA|nr:hypothetical protein PROFUN_13121 [Planoprotostelium fungivorum]